MMTYQQARELAQRWLDEHASRPDPLLEHFDAALNAGGCYQVNYKPVLIDEYTQEESFGWVFFYQSKKYLETGDFRHALAGNAPLIITRTGELHVTGTAEPLERYLERFRATGDPYGKDPPR